jgi:hypothetical protein
MPREQERVTYFKEVTIDLASGRRQARISDIGPGGCFVDSIVSVTESEPVTIEISGLNGHPIKLTGKVAYTLAGIGFGLRFMNLASEEQAEVDKMVAELNRSKPST